MVNGKWSALEINSFAIRSCSTNSLHPHTQTYLRVSFNNLALRGTLARPFAALKCAPQGTFHCYSLIFQKCKRALASSTSIFERMEALAGLATLAQLTSYAVNIISSVCAAYRSAKQLPETLQQQFVQVTHLKTVLERIQEEAKSNHGAFRNVSIVESNIRVIVARLVHIKDALDTASKKQQRRTILRLFAASIDKDNLGQLSSLLVRLEADKTSLILCISIVNAGLTSRNERLLTSMGDSGRCAYLVKFLELILPANSRNKVGIPEKNPKRGIGERNFRSEGSEADYYSPKSTDAGESRISKTVFDSNMPPGRPQGSTESSKSGGKSQAQANNWETKDNTFDVDAKAHFGHRGEHQGQYSCNYNTSGNKFLGKSDTHFGHDDNSKK